MYQKGEQEQAPGDDFIVKTAGRRATLTARTSTTPP